MICGITGLEIDETKMFQDKMFNVVSKENIKGTMFCTMYGMFKTKGKAMEFQLKRGIRATTEISEF